MSGRDTTLKAIAHARPAERGRVERLAALDLGTNNCRLLVAEPSASGFVVLDSFSRIVRLGEGLAATGRLSDAAMARTLAALKVCARLLGRNRVDRLRCVATEACRRAENGPAFLEQVEQTCGISFEVLHGHEEAKLAMLGCLPLVDPDAGQLLMLDIGGGSTELMLLDRFAGSSSEARAISVPLGVVNLAERFGSDMDEQAYAEMVATVTERLDAARRGWPWLPADGRLQMLGTSGTVTTLAAVHLGLRRYDRRKVDGLTLSFDAIRRVGRSLRSMGNAARASNPCIGPGRADLVVAGCALLDAVHQLWPVDRLRVADRGLREGILSELMGMTLDHVLIRPGRAA
jgi:exopolyphosphatase/guanosine-5'-triphosphate,3'-diphosphate pyrophosphatase